MVLRTFPAFDNEAFTVAPGSPSLAAGSPIINNSNTPVGTLFEFTSGFPYQSVQLDDTSFDPDTFDDDDPGNHVIVNGQGLVADGTEVESESYHFVRALDEFGNEVGPTITITVFSKDGDFTDIWGMAADAELQEGVIYKKIAGSNNGDSEYSDFVPCFTLGTRLATQRGEALIEILRPGDRLLTRDSGFREIAWIGKKTLLAPQLHADEGLAPIRIRAGALGPDLPGTDLTLSPNHRVLLRGSDIAMNYGTPEVLIAAKFLLGRPGVEIVKPDVVTYVHIMFDRHEVVLSNDGWTESFLPGPQALTGVDHAQCQELFRLFPELESRNGSGTFDAARHILTRKEALLSA